MIICWFCSLPRTLSGLSKLGLGSESFTFISILLAIVFAAIEDRLAKYKPGPLGLDADGNGQEDPIVTIFLTKGTMFVACMNAFLNISYTFIGQITLPSFIDEMREPRDPPKALWAVTIAEIILFSLIGSIIYAYTGNQYITSPAFGPLGNEV